MKLELSTFNDVLQVPTMFEVVESSELAFDKLLRSWRQLTQQQHRVVVLCGSSGLTMAMASQYARFFSEKVDGRTSVRQIKSASLREARLIDALCARDGITLLVAIGGGKVIDTAKMVVKQRNIALLCVPTALSSDGITSPVSVLENDRGQVSSFPSSIPSCVLVDLSLTVRAPRRLTLSGIGDVLSNASSLLDVDDYESSGGGQVNGFAKLLSHSACQLVLPLMSEDLDREEGHEALARALILSGLSMAFSGNSLPCSGAEHLISHALDHHRFGNGTHGLQVGLATLYCFSLRRLQNRDVGLTDVLPTMVRLGLPTHPSALGLSRKEFMIAVSDGPSMRHDRFTILHQDLSRDLLELAFEDAFNKGNSLEQ